MLVVYVAGWGRSGSTLLGNLLGEIPGYISIGELRYLFHPGITCGCGNLAADCSFWSEVTSRAESRIGQIDRAVFVDEQVRALAPKRVPLLIWKTPGDEAARVLRVTQALHTAVADVSGADVVVDGSKHPGDLAGLSSSPALRAVHLIRDPRATGYSWTRRRRQGQQALSLKAATFRWVEWNLFTELVLSRMSPTRRLRLRYEDFISNPRLHVNQIADLVGTGERLPGSAVSAGVAKLGGNHAVGGNPSKFKTGEVRLAQDDAWRRELGLPARAFVAAMAWPLMLRYGYEHKIG
jgi:hypothetical protein